MPASTQRKVRYTKAATGFFSRLAHHSTLRSSASLALIMLLAVLPLPVLGLQGALAFGIERVEAAAEFLAGGLTTPRPAYVFGAHGTATLAQDAQTALPAERASFTSSIVINSTQAAAFVGDRVSYTAQARDAGGNVIHGIKFAWSSIDTNKVAIDEAGRASMLSAGTATIVCSGGSVTTTAQVVIRAGSRLVG